VRAGSQSLGARRKRSESVLDRARGRASRGRRTRLRQAAAWSSDASAVRRSQARRTGAPHTSRASAQRAHPRIAGCWRAGSTPRLPRDTRERVSGLCRRRWHEEGSPCEPGRQDGLQERTPTSSRHTSGSHTASVRERIIQPTPCMRAACRSVTAAQKKTPPMARATGRREAYTAKMLTRATMLRDARECRTVCVPRVRFSDRRDQTHRSHPRSRFREPVQTGCHDFSITVFTVFLLRS
jgi:hypothetical protein